MFMGCREKELYYIYIYEKPQQKNCAARCLIAASNELKMAFRLQSNKRLSSLKSYNNNKINYY